MIKKEVIDILEQKHQILYEWLKNLPDENWVKGPEGKWNTGEHIVHLIQSENYLNKALRTPKFYLKYKFGTNNRENRTYSQIVKKYQDKLKNNPGVVANISKNMPIIKHSDKISYLSKLDKEKKVLIKKFQKWTEHDLDIYLLPHPLMGRMTIREIVIWTAYHTEHHCNILKMNH
ncbi:DinB family protein [Aquimarina algiphila]|uniref:DinB family protein n=1 Tax=Aquimarina algiphila TaxID=2047982 RepID=UPI00232BFEE6|nr:DinB family protein [Aquimarina algiphila]